MLPYVGHQVSLQTFEVVSLSQALVLDEISMFCCNANNKNIMETVRCKIVFCSIDSPVRKERNELLYLNAELSPFLC